MSEYMGCNICNSKSHKLINICRITKEDADIPETFLSLVKCKVCGLIFINPLPKISANYLYTRDYFNKEYMKYYGDTADKKGVLQSNESFAFRLFMIEKYCTKRTLLDVGSATGGFLKFVQDRGWYASGVELSEYAAEIAVKKNKVNVFNGSLEEAHFDENCFDVVCASDILEHVVDPSRFLKEVHHILKNSGVLYLAVPNSHSFYYRLFGLIARFNRRNYFVLPHHLYHFNHSSLKIILDKVGFKILELQFSNSRSSILFMNLFNYHDRIIILAKKIGGMQK